MKLLTLLLLTTTAAAQSQPTPTCPQPTHIAMPTATFSSQPGVTFQLHNFAATLDPIGHTYPTCLNRLTVMSHGEIFISNEALTNVFTEKLGNTESKIKGFKIENGAGHVTLSGHITKLIPIDFSVVGPVTTDGTVLLLTAQKIKADGIPIKALLGLIGDHLSSIFNLHGVSGITVTDNTISFSPEQIAHLKGHITAAETSDAGLTLRYGPISRKRQHANPPATQTPPESHPAPAASRSPAS